jgi:type II secretory pathway pseudopilin PulG
MDGNTSAISRPAFTIAEIVVAVGLSAMVFSVVGFLGVRWFDNRQLQVTAKTFVSYLRTAAVRAIQSEGGADHGVSRAYGQLTLFRGSSYAGRDPAWDTVFPYAGSIQVSGPAEVVFSRQAGWPSATGTFVFANAFRSVSITVHSTGAISGP